jgi:hypothetical protein
MGCMIKYSSIIQVVNPERRIGMIVPPKNIRAQQKLLSRQERRPQIIQLEKTVEIIKTNLDRFIGFVANGFVPLQV